MGGGGGGRGTSKNTPNSSVTGGSVDLCSGTHRKTKVTGYLGLNRGEAPKHVQKKVDEY